MVVCCFLVKKSKPSNFSSPYNSK